MAAIDGTVRTIDNTDVGVGAEPDDGILGQDPLLLNQYGTTDQLKTSHGSHHQTLGTLS